MNKLFKYIICTVLLVTGVQAYSHAQSFRNNTRNNFSPYRKIEAAKEGYINRQLDLSDEQSEKFWPMYKQYNQELTEVRKLKRQNMLNNRGKDQLDKDLYYEQQLVDIKRKYTQEFSKILPPAKVNLVFRSENEFKDELLKIYRERGTPD